MGDPTLASDIARPSRAGSPSAVEVLVPEGVAVDLSGGGALGSLAVRSRPGLADQIKDSARRLAERLNQPRD